MYGLYLYIYTRIYNGMFNLHKEGNPAICYNINESGGHHAE